MLARTNDLRHPSGARLKTPVLIPSFSSKGFGKAEGRSEVHDLFEAAQEVVTDAMLVSAYDIHHGHLSLPERAVPEIVFVDSGGYETSAVQDLSSPFVYEPQREEWTRDLHYETLAKWPSHIPAVFVSFDSTDEPLSIADQLARAIPLTEEFRHQMHAFLAKPDPSQPLIDVAALLGRAREISRFSVLGVTEKEIGDSFIARMRTIAELRMGLDQRGLDALPIHVFGSLDPSTVCLYFAAGAELFDGLTWLRYAYSLDVAMYRHNAALLHDMLTQRDSRVRAWAMANNMGQLEALRNKLRRFLNDGDFSVLPRGGEWVAAAMELLRAELGGRQL